MRPTAKVDLSGFDQSVRALARLGKTTIDDVLPWAAASAVKRAMNRTRVLSTDTAVYKARRSVADATGLRKGEGSITDTANLRKDFGRTWRKVRRSDSRVALFAYTDNGFTPQDKSSTGRPLPDKYRADHIAKVDAFTTAYREAYFDALRSVYFPKKSWLDILDDIGLPIETVAPKGAKDLQKIRDAVAKNGRKHRNGSALKRDGKSSLEIELTNQYPALDKLDFRRLMAYGVNAVAKQTKKDFEKNFFDNAKRTAARYPFLKVS